MMPKHERILACLERFKAFSSKQLMRTRWAGDPIMDTQFERREAWLNARYDYLAEEYRKALNEADDVIGKQWAYDNRPKLSLPRR